MGANHVGHETPFEHRHSQKEPREAEAKQRTKQEPAQCDTKGRPSIDEHLDEEQGAGAALGRREHRLNEGGEVRQTLIGEIEEQLTAFPQAEQHQDHAGDGQHAP